MNNHDEPCTGEPARPAVAYIGTAGGLFVTAVLSVDFYADASQPFQCSGVNVNPRGESAAVVHEPKFCPGEPLNATQQICEA